MEQALEERIRAELADGLVREAAPPDAVEIPPIPVERYVSEDVYELEQRHVWGRAWLFAGHESELAEPGAFTLFTKTTAPLVIVRGHDGVIRAFYNSCRHRGAPVVRETCGTAKRLTCLYHSWSYDTQGRLRAIPDARNFVDADEDELGLVRVRCESWEGFLFVS
jgi:phenylpropionate dioxygenase-like ring-hydroxylating dioxygenase large terminal subunit